MERSRRLERMTILNTQDVDAVVETAAQRAATRNERGTECRRTAQVHARIAHEEMRVAYIDCACLRDLVLRAECNPLAILIRDTRRAELVSRGRLVVCDTEAQRPRLVHLVVHAEPRAPGVAPAERRVFQHETVRP